MVIVLIQFCPIFKLNPLISIVANFYIIFDDFIKKIIKYLVYKN